MPTIAIHFRGSDLEDVFVYRSSMYAWTYEQQLRIYAISDLEAAISRADPERGPVAAYWLFHSRGLGADEAQRSSVMEDELRGDYSLDLDLGSVPHRDLLVLAEAGSVMDMLVYYNFLYLASDGGLLAIDVAASEALHSEVPAHRTVRDPCMSASGGLGAVAASCGRNGLHLVFDSYDPEARRRRKVSDVSLRAELGSATVVNHLWRSELQFFSGDTVARPRARGKVLSEVRESTVEVGIRRSATDRLTDFTLWDQSRLVVFDGDGVQSVGVSRSRDVRTVTRTRHLYDNPNSRVVLSASRLGNAFAVETPTGVTIMRPDQAPAEVATGPVIGLRSYQRSLRYLRLATATSEQGLWLIGLSAPVSRED